MKKLLAAFLMLTLLLGLCACSVKPETTGEATETTDPTAIPEEDRYGGVLDLVWSDCKDNFDPHYTTGWVSYIWSFNVYEMPLSRDTQGNFCPGVCDFELSEDMLTLKLWPREGVTFHDGSAVEIEDVVASLDRAGKLVSNINKYFTEYLANTEVADGAVTYTFKEYSPNTMYYISSTQNWASIIPAEICEKYGENPINKIEDCIGTGPYKLTDYQSNTIFVLDRYDGYVAVPEGHDGMAGPKKAYMDRINVHINQDETSKNMGTLNGDYDIAFMDGEYAAMAAQYGLVSTPDVVSNLICLAFNTKGDRPVNDVNLRKAIAAAIDFAQVSESKEQHACDPDTSAMLGQYYSDKFNQADYVGASNMELAKEYLAKSDYNGEELVIIATDGNGTIVLEDYLKKLGLNVKVEYMEAMTLREYRDDNSNPYDIHLCSYEKRDYAPSLISTTAKNTYWGNERKDELFAQLASLPVGSEESHQLWDELVDLWVDDCAMVNLSTSYSSLIQDPDLNLNIEGTQRYFYNAYWSNPSEHMD